MTGHLPAEAKEFRKLEEKIGDKILDEFNEIQLSGRLTKTDETIKFLSDLPKEKCNLMMKLFARRKTFTEKVFKPIQLSFDEQFDKAEQLPYLPTSVELIKRIGDLFPHRVRKGQFELIDDTETATAWLKRYKIEKENQVIIFTFLIDKKDCPTKEEADLIPQYGSLTRQAWLVPHLLALATRNFKPTFRAKDVLRFHDFYTQEELKRVGGTYKKLKSAIRTLAYGKYEIRDKETEEPIEMGNFYEKVWFDPKKKTIQVLLSQETQEFFTSYLTYRRKTNFVKFPPKLRLTTQPRKRKGKYTFLPGEHGSELDNFLAQLRTLGRVGYPISAKTLFLKKMGFPKSRIKKLGRNWVWTTVREELDKAIERGTLTSYDIMQKENNEQYGNNPLKWKIRLVA